jgi:hypothetical protein
VPIAFAETPSAAGWTIEFNNGALSYSRLVNPPVLATHWVLCFFGRARSGTVPLTVTVDHAGLSFTQIATNYDATDGVADDFRYWIGVLDNPTRASAMLTVAFAGTTSLQRGFAIANWYIDSGLDLEDPVTVLAAQASAGSTDTVSLIGTNPDADGSVLVAAEAVSLLTTLASFTGSPGAWTGLRTETATVGDLLTYTVRYLEDPAVGAHTATAVFAAPSARIGGVLFRINSASTAVEDGVADAITPSDVYASTLVTAASVEESVTLSFSAEAAVAGLGTPESLAGTWSNAAASWRVADDGSDSRGLNNLTVADTA